MKNSLGRVFLILFGLLISSISNAVKCDPEKIQVLQGGDVITNSASAVKIAEAILVFISLRGADAKVLKIIHGK